MDRLKTTESGMRFLEELKARQEAKWEEVKDLDFRAKQKAFSYERSRRIEILSSCRTENNRSRILDNQHLLKHGWEKRAQSFRKSMERSLDWLISRGHIMEY